MLGRRTPRLSLVVAGLVTGVTAVIACGGASDTDEVGAPGVDGSAGGDGAAEAAATDDASPGDAGEIAITDGGSNLDPDAGEPPLLPDGGTCNTLANTASPVVSKCASASPVLGGGTIAAGTYALVSVVALAPAQFCSQQFVPTGFKQTLVLAAGGDGFDAKTVVEVGGQAPRHRDQHWSTTNGRLAITQSCPGAGAVEAAYLATVTNGKPTIVARLPYGKGEALYTYRAP